MAPITYYPYPYVVAAQYQQSPFQCQTPPQHQQPPQAQVPQNQCRVQNNKNQGCGKNRPWSNNQYGRFPKYDKILVPDTQLLP